MIWTFLFVFTAQSFAWSNMVTVLPLPDGKTFTNETRIRVRLLSVATNEVPAAPTHLRAIPRAQVTFILRWGAATNAPGETNFVYNIYESTDLTRWTLSTNFPPTTVTNHYPTWNDERRFFKVSASNELGENFVIKQYP